MSKYLGATALLLGVGLIVASQAADEPIAAKKIAALVEKLGSSEFEDREQATTDLDKLGLDALEALKVGARSSDAEIRRRAEELVTKIEKRESSTLILKPTRVTLALKDATVAEAIAALRKQSNFPIQLLDPEEKARATRVTLDLKDVTFWEALDALCAKAELVEGGVSGFGGFGAPPGVKPIRIRPIRGIGVPAPQPIPVPQPIPDRNDREEGFAFVPPPADPVPPPAPPVQAQVQIQRQVIIGGQGGVIIGGMPGPGGFSGPTEGIVLTPGKVEKLPTDVATSFRVRTGQAQFQIQVPGQTLHTVTLDVTPEPRFRYISTEKVEITKAIDDLDQKLTRFDPNQPQNVPGNVGIGIAFPAGGPGWAGGGFPGGNGLTTLYFKAAEKASKSLKEISGTISARIEVPHSKAVVVEKLLDAGNKTFKGEKGGEIKVGKIDKVNDNVVIRLELLPAKDATGGNNGAENIGFPGGGIIFPGNVVPALPPQAVPPRKQIERLPPEPGFAFQAATKPQPAAPAQDLPAIAPPPPLVPAPAIAVAPIQIQLAPAGGQFPGGGIQFIGGGGMPPGVQITDADGKPVIVVGMNQQWNGAAQPVWEIHLAQGKDQPKAEKLTWQQYKSATVDVPFTLKNVPLN